MLDVPLHLLHVNAAVLLRILCADGGFFRVCLLNPVQESRDSRLQPLDHGGHNLAGCVFPVVGLDDRPGRAGGIGLLQHLIGYGLICAVFLVALQILIGHTPGGFAGGQQGFHPLFLLLPGNVQEKLDDQRAAEGQLCLKIVDVPVEIRQLFRLCDAVKAVHHHTAVPAAVEDGDPAVRRRQRPEPPEERVALFILTLPVEGVHAETARIEGLDQFVDLRPFARRRDSFKDNQHRKLCRPLLPLQFGKPRAERTVAAVEFFSAHLSIQVNVFQHKCSFPLSFTGITGRTIIF